MASCKNNFLCTLTVHIWLTKLFVKFVLTTKALPKFSIFPVCTWAKKNSNWIWQFIRLAETKKKWLLQVIKEQIPVFHALVINLLFTSIWTEYCLMTKTNRLTYSIAQKYWQSLETRSSRRETRFSTLETFEDRVSRLENQVSSFDDHKGKKAFREGNIHTLCISFSLSQTSLSDKQTQSTHTKACLEPAIRDVQKLAQNVFPSEYVGWVCCWFSSLLQEVFLQVLYVYSKELLSGYATPKLLFCKFIY